MPLYNKLVRDKISEIISHKGETAITHIANDTEYWIKLKEKLREEVAELLEEENILEEMADIFEVLDAICAFQEIDPAKVKHIQIKKREERGGFLKRIILDETS